uniref:Uncharacterized protein n=1 Tax=Salix viminalis TaxID=40686 RepID=A0A6N2MGP2_SALVM
MRVAGPPPSCQFPPATTAIRAPHFHMILSLLVMRFLAESKLKILRSFWREATAYTTLADYRVILPRTGASVQTLLPSPRTPFSSSLLCYYDWSSVWRLPVDYG